jgi:hypothetical protein
MNVMPSCDPNCERCSTLRQRFEIRVPADLSKAIRVARDNVADGTIVEVPSPLPGINKPFSSILADGPWDDSMAYEFRCTTCGQLFSLSADTYHGSGGEWRPVSRL